MLMFLVNGEELCSNLGEDKLLARCVVPICFQEYNF